MFFIALSLLSCKKENASNSNADTSLVEVDYDGLNSYLSQDDGKVRIINFWATWCKPCIEELPSFKRLHKTYEGEDVEIIFVSLDFPSEVEKTLKPFIEKNEMPGTLLYMTDTKANTWIPKVNPNWQGSLPATIIYKGNKREFYEGLITYAQLENELQQFL